MSLSSSISTGTASAATATATTTACNVNYEIPTKDAACALLTSSNSTAILKDCCGVAEINSINNGCSSYCLAQGQDIGDLTSCFYRNGASANSVYCNEVNKTATATASITGTATGTGSTTVLTGTATGTGATASSTTGAAAPAAKVSVGGVGVLALMFCSALLRVFA
ncbi:hypothetical protein BGW36DRAFT_390037 [Talaromyces proteolyticus]|uniref:Uncharacterized protein n=1 Tax=Talaromyces proteolyticus TaxID=1131652 RepID=A0AAD4KE03_9EURO|nr:uncharacterized protein BGW36DRAFT_390037 [Talaromyces proteolyticus]KAH8689987.1 hypothetical protein BGW36DRAFT_390037 [Talaromyces proteolyticus]